MKRILFPLLILLTICLSSVSGFAYQEANGVVLDGKDLSLDVKPIIKDNRTLVPARALMEALGLKVNWDSKTNTVTGINSKHNIALKLNNEYDHEYNNIEFSLDVAPIAINNRTLVPVRIVAELLGLDVKWNNQNSKVIIKTTTEEPEISLEEAHNILHKHVKPHSNDYSNFFVYMPFNSYASGAGSIRDTTYIFGIGSRSHINSDWDYLADFNYCVNKYTGYIYEYHPGYDVFDGDYFWSDENPISPPSEEYIYPEFNEPGL